MGRRVTPASSMRIRSDDRLVSARALALIVAGVANVSCFATPEACHVCQELPDAATDQRGTGGRLSASGGAGARGGSVGSAGAIGAGSGGAPGSAGASGTGGAPGTGGA